MAKKLTRERVLVACWSAYEAAAEGFRHVVPGGPLYAAIVAADTSRSLDAEADALDSELANVEAGLVTRIAEYRLDGNPVGERADRGYLATVLEARAALCRWLEVAS